MLVHEFLENSTRKLPEKIALICGDERLTYREVNAASDLFADALIRHGAQKQDRVVIFLDNSAEAVVALCGTLKSGCIFILLNAEMKAKKLKYILNDSDAKFLVTKTKSRKIIEEAIVGNTSLASIVWCPGKGFTQELIQPFEGHFRPIVSLTWNSFLTFDSKSSPEKNRPQIIDVDIATIIYTSGSTADPKGVISAHYNVVSAARSITTYLKNIEDDIILSALPLSFDYGLYQVLMAFLFGGTVIIEKSFNYPYKVIEKLVKEKATGFPIVPTMVAILLRLEALKKFDFSFVRYLSNTAAALPVSYIKQLQAIFPKSDLYSMYGLTECKRVSYLPPEFLDSKPESVGIPMPNEEVFIVDDKGNEVAAGQIGELVVRGSNVMRGYWNAPEETKQRFRTGRYSNDLLLYTGDLFKMDNDGFLYFISRKDDLIKTKGERVSPKEIENVLCDLDDISEAVVIAVPDEIIGNAIKAFIVPKQNTELSERQVQTHCIKNLEPFMVPRFIEFLDSLPKTANGKIDKKKLYSICSQQTSESFV
jgi:amino acid adenylation domain-containing protein